MSPLKFVLSVVLLVFFTGTFFLLRGVLAEALNLTWQGLFGRSFGWEDVPLEWHATLRLLNLLADNIFAVGVLLALAVVLVEAYQKTREGRVSA